MEWELTTPMPALGPVLPVSSTLAMSANLTNRPSSPWAKFITALPFSPSSAAATSSGPPISRP